MEMSTYNLAKSPRINRRLSRWRIMGVVLSTLILVGSGAWRLDRFLSQQHSLRNEAAALRLRQDQARRKISLADKVIQDQKKIWLDRIEWANGLVNTTAPIISRHFEQLEALLPERVRLENLTFDRKGENSLTLEVVAATSSELFELYRRLAGFELKVAGESGFKDGAIKAGLTVAFPSKGR